jgi:uncharacterized protein involved in exopolysaccharide biosynthesis
MAEFDESEEGSGLPEFLMDPKGVLQRRWPWMLAVLLLVGVAGAAFVAMIPQTFQASARLLLTHPRISEDLVAPASENRIPELVNAVVGEVLARDSLIRIAETLDLPAKMGFDGPAAALVGHMRRGITVEPDLDLESQRHRRNTGEESVILANRYESADPQIAADVANQLASRFQSVHRDRQLRDAKVRTEFLRREQKSLEEELAQHRTRKAEFTKANRGRLPSELETKLARLDRLQEYLQSLAIQITEAEGRLLVLRDQGRPGTKAALLADLRTRLAHERAVHTDEHPNVIALERQVAILEAEVRAESAGGGGLDPAVAAVQQELQVLRGHSRQTEQEIRALEAAVARIPDVDEEFKALQQQEDLLEERLAEASRKVRDSELDMKLVAEGQGFRITELDRALPPTEPMRSRLKFAALAVMAALGASVMTGLLFEVIDPVIVSARQLETRTGALPLGIVPRIR